MKVYTKVITSVKGKNSQYSFLEKNLSFFNKRKSVSEIITLKEIEKDLFWDLIRFQTIYNRKNLPLANGSSELQNVDFMINDYWLNMKKTMRLQKTGFYMRKKRKRPFKSAAEVNATQKQK